MNRTLLRFVILDNCFVGRFSVFEFSLVVLGGIFNLTDKRTFFSFDNLNLAVVEPQSPVLTSTPQSKI